MYGRIHFSGNRKVTNERRPNITIGWVRLTWNKNDYPCRPLRIPDHWKKHTHTSGTSMSKRPQTRTATTKTAILPQSEAPQQNVYIRSDITALIAERPTAGSVLDQCIPKWTEPTGCSKRAVLTDSRRDIWSTSRYTVLGPMLFLLYINDIVDNVDSQMRLFADDSIVYRELTRGPPNLGTRPSWTSYIPGPVSGKWTSI